MGTEFARRRNSAHHRGPEGRPRRGRFSREGITNRLAGLPLGGLVARFGQDRQGGTAVQALVFMPVIIFSFVVGMMFWETLMVRRSLHTGTYLATRFMSLYPLDTNEPFAWEDVARKFVIAELKNSPFVDKASINDINPRITVTLFDSFQCDDKFEVIVEYTLWAPLERTSETILPGRKLFTLRESRTGEVICGKD